MTFWRGTAVMLVAGGKTGIGEKRFYKALINKPDARYRRRLEDLEKQAKAEQAKKQEAAKKGKEK